MKKLILLAIIFLTSSCQGLSTMGCYERSARKINYAKEMYNTWGTALVSDMTPQRADKMFGCYYRAGDRVYSYKTLWGEKFILVRYGDPLTYYDGPLIK
jgi:hypothetical protein